MNNQMFMNWLQSNWRVETIDWCYYNLGVDIEEMDEAWHFSHAEYYFSQHSVRIVEQALSNYKKYVMQTLNRISPKAVAKVLTEVL